MKPPNPAPDIVVEVRLQLRETASELPHLRGVLCLRDLNPEP